MRTKLALIIAPIAFALGACETLAPPEEQVVYEMYDAMCAQRDVAAMKPYLTKSSQGLLGFVTLAFMANGNMTMADAIAQSCANGRVEIANKVQVNEGRYVMDVVPPGSSEPTKLVVLQEEGQWKVALAGK